MIRAYLLVVFFCSLVNTGMYSQNWSKLKNGLGDFGDVRYYVDQERNELYINGFFFTDKEGNNLRGITKWNGFDYTPVGEGGPNSPIVYGVARYRDTLYISTWLYNDSTFNNLYWWGWYNETTSEIDTLYTGLINGKTYAFQERDGVLYASGLFSICGSDSTWGICSFDGISWKSIYNGTRLDPADNMADFTWYKDKMYVAGNFWINDGFGGYIKYLGVLQDGIIYPVGSGLQGSGFTNVSAMTVYKNELYIGGYFLQSDGNPTNHIVKWDGSQFKPVGGGVDNQVTDMIVYKDNLYVSGKFIYADGIYSPLIARWDGYQWHAFNTDEIDSNNTGKINDLEVYQNELYIAGKFYTINGDTFNHVAKYNHQLPGDENELEVLINNPGEEIIISYEDSNMYGVAVAIFTVTGQQVGSYIFPHQQGYLHQSIPIPGLASGVYIVEAIAGNKTVSKKLLKLN